MKLREIKKKKKKGEKLHSNVSFQNLLNIILWCEQFHVGTIFFLYLCTEGSEHLLTNRKLAY